MKKIMAIMFLSSLPFSASLAGDGVKDRAEQSQAVVKQFMGQLVTKLKGAMNEGGPVNAIQVCNTAAPAIAKQISDKTGWDVGRTSLKLRNQSNAADAWEAAVLKKFAERRAAGESPAKMAYFEVVEENGKKNFRFMKAIGMPPLAKMPCLKCHGENIDGKMVSKLDELYPADKARGYKPGEIRGAFTITQPM